MGVINWMNAAVVVLLMIPNLIYAVQLKKGKVKRISNAAKHTKKTGITKAGAGTKKAGQGNKLPDGIMNGIEQVGRYGCMLFMIWHLGLREFDFDSVVDFLLWLVVTMLLLAAYWVFWFLYFKNAKTGYTMALAVIPCIVFLLTGFVLHHACLVIAAVLFTVGHVYITRSTISHE